MNVDFSHICLPSMLSSHDKNHVSTENVSASCLTGATLIYYNRTCEKSSLSAVPPRWNLCHVTQTSTTRFLKNEPSHPAQSITKDFLRQRTRQVGPLASVSIMLSDNARSTCYQHSHPALICIHSVQRVFC